METEKNDVSYQICIFTHMYVCMCVFKLNVTDRSKKVKSVRF